MKALIAIVLCLAATGAQAQAVDKAQPRKPAASSAAETPRSKLASVAIIVADDGDTITLPPIASRTTPVPARAMRVGVQWLF